MPGPAAAAATIETVATELGLSLRRARDAMDADGASVAAAASSIGNVALDWSRLREFERGLDLPSTAQAVALAGVLDRDLEFLLGLQQHPRLKPTATRAVPAPPTPDAEPDPELVAKLADRLARKGFDPGLAGEFASYGIPDGMLKRWMEHFDPEDALAWIRLGKKPHAASVASKNGETPHPAGSESGAPPSSEGVGPPQEPGVAAPVLRLWLKHSDLATAQSWLDAGWDLLSALAWLHSGLTPENARSWHLVPIVPGDLTVVTRVVADPVEAAGWIASGIEQQNWSSWRGVDFSPAEAHNWSVVIDDPVEAAEYRHLVDDPNRAGWYRSMGVSGQEAARWDRSSLSWSETQAWLVRDVEPEEAEDWIRRGFTPRQVVPLSEVRVEAGELNQWIDQGFGPAEVPEWASRGFDVGAASRWRVFGAARAQRLRRRGMSPGDAIARADRGRLRRSEPGEYLRTRDRYLQSSHPSECSSATNVNGPARPERPQSFEAPVPPADAICHSCGIPLSVNGRCGCS